MLEKTKTVVSGDDLAIAIQLTVQFHGQRALAFSTACPQDIEDAELTALLRRLSKAADALDATYQLRSMYELMEAYERELSTNRQQAANYEQQAADQFTGSGRFGPLKLTASQEAALKNFNVTEEGLKAKITKLREQIAEMEQRSEVG